MVLLLYHHEDILISQRKKQLSDQINIVITTGGRGEGKGEKCGFMWRVYLSCFSAYKTFELETMSANV